MNSMLTITQKDIADEFGVSQATVSYTFKKLGAKKDIKGFYTVLRYYYSERDGEIVLGMEQRVKATPEYAQAKKTFDIIY